MRVYKLTANLNSTPTSVGPKVTSWHGSEAAAKTQRQANASAGTPRKDQELVAVDFQPSKGGILKLLNQET